MYRRYTLMFCYLVVLSLLMPCHSIVAQDAKGDPFWRQFDERYPELAGKGPALWEKAGQLAKLQLGQDEGEAFATRQNLVFQALAVNERDHVIISKKAKTREEHAWIASRRKANLQFQKDVDTIKALRAKADNTLTQDDMTQLLEASVSLMRYIYESQIQANEKYFESVVQENPTQRKTAESTKDETTSASDSDSPSQAGTRDAKAEDFQAYLQTDRIRIEDDDDDDRGPLNRGRNEYDRNHVQITGAIKNLTGKPARFTFQVVGLRANKSVVGLKTITTPVIAPNGVHEIDTKMPVEHSAYVRSVDMREVKIVNP